MIPLGILFLPFQIWLIEFPSNLLKYQNSFWFSCGEFVALVFSFAVVWHSQSVYFKFFATKLFPVELNFVNGKTSQNGSIISSSPSSINFMLDPGHHSDSFLWNYSRLSVTKFYQHWIISFFSDILHDTWSWCLVTDRARFLKINFGGLNLTNMGLNQA